MRQNRSLRDLPESLSSDDHEYVFVVTYGRTGSTLMQGLLNALPRTLVRGENGFYVQHLFRAADTALAFGDLHMRHKPRATSSAFYGVHLMEAGRFVRSSRRLMKSILLGPKPAAEVDRIGFKEVLWHEITPEETEAFFGWFEDVFPGARYVLNTRDPETAVGSGFWRREPTDDAFAKITRVIDIQDYLRTSRPDRVLDTRYEEVTSADAAVSDAALRALATFVTGGCDDVLLASLREVLATGHGPRPFGKSRRTTTASDGTL